MGLIDLLLIVVILISVYYGYNKGFILGAIDLLLLALSIAFAVWTSEYIAAFFEHYLTTIGVWALPMAFFICFIFARAFLGALSVRMIQKLSVEVNKNAINKALGVVPGALNGIIYAAIISAVIISSPLFMEYSDKTRESFIVNALTPSVEWAEGKLAPVFAKAVSRSSENFTVNPGSEKSYKLPFSVKNPKIREDLEAEMLKMINKERQKVGLSALKADPEIRKVARAHSKDMFAKSYFSHVNKEGETPADRVRKAGVRFLTVGENLALAPTLEVAHMGLMNSPGHRANILYKYFGRVGIGILEDSRQGLMITQNFRN
ncbi:MAG: Colicin production protein [Sphingobacteriales bacterium]|nr:Colicin production protein [Sphingobacteriales bacterium]